MTEPSRNPLEELVDLLEVKRLAHELGVAHATMRDTGVLHRHQRPIREAAITLRALLAQRERDEEALARWRENSRETFDAMCAMRNDLNEMFPMPSLESDLLQGPEASVFFAAVVQAVRNTRERDEKVIERLNVMQSLVRLLSVLHDPGDPRFPEALDLAEQITAALAARDAGGE